MIAMISMLTVPLTSQTVSAKLALNSDVSVWDSAIVPDAGAGIFPVGGAGQIAGNFAVDTKTKKDTAIQVGLRAQERFVGPIEPFGRVYLAPTGEAPAGSPLWNFDFHLDSGTEFLETQLGEDLTALNLEDFTVVLEIKDLEKNVWTLALSDFPNPAGPIILSQQSWNIGFGFIEIPIDSKAYDIKLTVSNDKGRTLAESKITVVVTDEIPVDDKITLCHKEQTITVPVHLIQNHLRHGDSFGAC